MLLKSFRSRVFTLIFSILSLTVLFITQHVRQTTIRTFSNTHYNSALNLTHIIEHHVEAQYNSIQFNRRELLRRRKIALKNYTELALVILREKYNASKKGEYSELIAKKNAGKAIESMRYGNNIGYFWINDTGKPYPRMIMHPIMPELNGQILDNPRFNCALATSENLFKAFVDTCLEKGEGFVDYLWPKPTEKGSGTLLPKISYVTIFKPWNWIIGTGVYIDDIEAEANTRHMAVMAELQKVSEDLKIIRNGYMIIFDDDYKLLVHPYLLFRDSIAHYNDNRITKILQGMKTAKLSGKQTYDYSWDRPEDSGNYTYKKRAYITYYKPLGWYVVSVVFLADENRTINLLSRQIVIYSTVFLVLALIIALFLARSLTNPLSKLVHSVEQVKAHEIDKVVIPAHGTCETKVLAQALNVMIRSINQSQEALIESEQKYRKLIDYSLVGNYITQANILKFCNQRFAEIFGYTDISELIGCNVKQLVDAADWEKVSTEVTLRETKKKEYSQYEFKGRRKDGTIIHLEVMGSSLDYLGEPAIQGTLIDITSRKFAEAQVKKDLKEKEILLREIHHRVKNNLNIVTSLLNLQARRIQNKEQALAAFEESRDRIYTMALVHEKLYQTNDFSQINIKSYLKSLCNDLIRSYAPEGRVRIEFEAPLISLNINSAIPCGLILNELITNALKHAFPDGREGTITIIFSMDERDCQLLVKDDGIGMSTNINVKSANSLGLKLVNILSEQLMGKLEIKRDKGTSFTLKFPSST